MQTGRIIIHPSFSEDDLRCRQEALDFVVSPALHRLITHSQPQQVLAFLHWAAGHEPDQISAQCSNSLLDDLAVSLNAILKRDPRLARGQLHLWLPAVISNLAQDFGDLLHPDNTVARQKYRNLLTGRSGAALLSDYDEPSGQREADLVMWCKNSVELPLIAAAQDGDRRAFDRLHERYKGMVYGSISYQTKNDADAQDVAQETWIKVWEKIQIFDPSRGSFASFLKYWAGIVLLRHFSKRKRRLRFEQLLSDLCDLYPDIENQNDVRELVARFSEEGTGSGLFTKVPDEVVDLMLEIVFRVSGLPHYSFAFAYIVLLHWKPSEVVDEISKVPFGELFENLREGLRHVWSLSDGRVDRCLRPLRIQLRDSKLARESLQANYTYGIQRKTKNGKEMSEALQNAADLTIWWDSVKKRIVAEISNLNDGPLREWLDEHFQD